MASSSYGFWHGLCLATETLRLESDSAIPSGRSKYRSFAAKGLPSGTSSDEHGPTVRIFSGPVQFRESLALRADSSFSFLTPSRIAVQPNQSFHRKKKSPRRAFVKERAPVLNAGDIGGTMFANRVVRGQQPGRDTRQDYDRGFDGLQYSGAKTTPTVTAAAAQYAFHSAPNQWRC